MLKWKDNQAHRDISFFEIGSVRMESEDDYQFLKQYAKQLIDKDYKCTVVLGYGRPKTVIPNLVAKNNCDLLVMGTHGHKTFKDILLGTTIEGVRHNINVPLVLV